MPRSFESTTNGSFPPGGKVAKGRMRGFRNRAHRRTTRNRNHDNSLISPRRGTQPAPDTNPQIRQRDPNPAPAKNFAGAPAYLKEILFHSRGVAASRLPWAPSTAHPLVGVDPDHVTTSSFNALRRGCSRRSSGPERWLAASDQRSFSRPLFDRPASFSALRNPR